MAFVELTSNSPTTAASNAVSPSSSTMKLLLSSTPHSQLRVPLHYTCKSSDGSSNKTAKLEDEATQTVVVDAKKLCEDTGEMGEGTSNIFSLVQCEN